MTGTEKRIVKDTDFLSPTISYKADDSAEDTEDDSEDDQFEDLLSVLNEVKDLRKQLSEQNQSLDEELKRLSEAVRIESVRSESLTQNVEKLGRKVGVKNDSLKEMRDKLGHLCTEWEVIAKVLNFDCESNLLDDLGKIAVYVERAICCHVLPEIFTNGSKASLCDLLIFFER